MEYNITPKSRLNLNTWKRIWPFIRPVRGRLAAAMVLTLASAAIDSAYTLFTKYAVDLFIVPQTTRGLLPFCLIYLGIILLQGVLTIYYSRQLMVVEMETGRQMKKACFTHLQKLSLTYYNQTPVGYILARVMSDTNKISGLLAWVVNAMFWDLAYLTGIFISMLILNWRMALIIILIVPAIGIVTFFIKNKLQNINREVRTINSKITGVYNEGITGAKTIKTLVIEDKIAHEFSGVTGEFFSASMGKARLNAVFIPLATFLGSMATAAVLYQGGRLVLDDLLLYGTFSAFISYALVILEPVQQIAGFISEIIAAQINAERVIDLLDHQPAIDDTPEVKEKYGDLFNPKEENWESIRGKIEFRDIWFKYPDGDQYVLENFNLTIPAGTTVAIVGRTGAGKSTLVNLACRFLEPTRGHVLIDGVDYRERSMLWLQSRLGYVLQNPHLFSGTVMENIRYGRLDATDEQCIAAAKLVCAHEAVEKLEHGYYTDVGEGGDRLSTGEKQLLSFARAVLADPPIFVLDEATSSVDTETEGLIQQAISRILQGRTSFIIAHRLSTIRHADLILVVDEGRIVERGTHGELMAQRGKYHNLYTAMRLEEEDAQLKGFMPQDRDEEIDALWQVGQQD